MYKIKKLLVFGPTTWNNERVGGLTVSFQVFLDQLTKNKIEFIVINTNKVSYKYKSIALIKIYWAFFKNIKNSSFISLHGSDKDYIYLAPIVIFLSKIFNKKVCLRKFAGAFNSNYQNFNKFEKLMIRYSLRNSDINYFQTKYLIDFFKKYNKNTFWFPTVRVKKKINNSKQLDYQKKFIYLGHIYPEKGVDIILETAKSLDNSYIIDLYGPITDERYSPSLWKEYKNVSYKGVLAPNEVAETLALYDVLILPSYREGYPGVIIEAFSVGLPVIATRLEGILEMLEEESGILIDVGNSKALKEAILFFNQDNYKKFSESALENFQQFDADIVIKEIIERMKTFLD